jgi:hypothetical protein
MFALVDTLAEKVAAKEAAGERRGRDDGDDRIGWRGASLSKSYSHPIVKQRRERGDFAGAVDLAQKLFATHVPKAEILYIARDYADAGDYAGAMEVGGSAGGQYCSDSGIRGYTAHAMFKQGKKEEAEKLLTDTLREIDGGKMTLHRDFIVGLALCGKVDDALRVSATLPVHDRSEHDEPTDKYAKNPSLVFTCLLMSDRDAEAVKLIDELKDAPSKAWGIRSLIQWDYEEYIVKEKASLLSPELRKRWTDFLVNYADTLEEPNVINRIGELYRAAECLMDLGYKPAALKVLDKAMKDINNFDKELPDHLRYGSYYARVQTGRLLLRLGERQKADTAFVAAIQDIALYKGDGSHTLYLQNHRKAESLGYILFYYTDALSEAKPEQIRTWGGYQRSENDSRIGYMTLRYLWGEYRLFSWYGIQ